MRYLIILLFLTGCSNLTQVYYPNDKGLMIETVRVRQSSTGSVKYNPETKEITVDTRSKNFWQQNIVPILAGLANKVEAQGGI